MPRYYIVMTYRVPGGRALYAENVYGTRRQAEKFVKNTVAKLKASDIGYTNIKHKIVKINFPK